jgi:hypothetical protein
MATLWVVATALALMLIYSGASESAKSFGFILMWGLISGIVLTPLVLLSALGGGALNARYKRRRAPDWRRNDLRLNRFVMPCASLLLGAGTFGAIFTLANRGIGSPILQLLLIPGLALGTLLSGGPHGGNGLIWLVCVVAVNVIIYSYLWWLVVRRLPFVKTREGYKRSGDT